MMYVLHNKISRRISLALLLLGAALPGRAQDAGKEQLTVALSAPGKPGALEVSLVNGSIRVTGYSGKDVVIEAVARPGKPHTATPATATGLRRIPAGNSLNLTAEEKNNRVEISTESWKGPIDLAIKVPRNFSLKVSTVNDGDIAVENVAGELEVTNVNGDIKLLQVAGSAVANTVNGDLIATFARTTAGAPMAFSTLNGKVDVTLPASVSAALKMKSDRGSVYSDFDVALSKGQPKVTRSAQNGVSRLSTDDWTYGKINGGGAEVTMKTFNGDIYLRKAK
jgi:DUF4097 and DUF4098 domain-containing protein YvlB